MFLLLFLGLGWRQLILHEHYREQEAFQNQRRVLYPGPRGKIFDRNGNVLVANRPRFAAVVYLNDLKKEIGQERKHLSKQLRKTQPDLSYRERFEEAAWGSRLNVLQAYLDQINQILERDDEVVLKKLKRHYGYRRLMPFPLINDLTHTEYAHLIEQLPIGSPIQIYTSTAREYPQGSLAAHTIGYVVSDESIPEKGVPGEGLKTFSYKGKSGRSGLEKSFEDTLQGHVGGEVWLVDPMQYQHAPVPEKSLLPRPGDDVITSLDIDLQRVAENAIGDRTGAAIAVDVNTGEILVLASKPDYDLNDLTPFISNKVWKDIGERGAFLNRAFQGLYPPGSTFKLITAIAAMRADKLGPAEPLTCGSHLRVGNRLFPEHSNASFGQVNLPRALEVSSNVFFYQVGLRTGIDPISAEARRFGLDEPTDIELPHEATRMIVPDREWKQRVKGFGWTKGDTVNVSIGQGYLLVTPLQMARFAASLARRETRTKLTLLKQPAGKIIDHEAEPIGLTGAQYYAILQGMSRVVSLSGTGRWAAVEGVNIAGKTGTAQVRHEGKPLTIAWFLGFAPIDNPKIAVVIAMEGTEEDDNYGGGKTAAPIAQKIFHNYFYPTDNRLAVNSR